MIYHTETPNNLRSIYVPKTMAELRRVVRETLFIEPQAFAGGEIRTLAQVLAATRPIGISGSRSERAVQAAALHMRHDNVSQVSFFF